MTVGTHPDTPALMRSTSWPSTRSARCRSTPCRRPTGAPHTPMALAPVTYKLWQDYLRFDPELPVWANRIGSCCRSGTRRRCCTRCCTWAGSVGQPRLRDVGEPAVSLDDPHRFRQLDSKCPGHPEYRWTSGVECTTGPLGTGIATSVSMAIAGLWQAATFNRPGYELFDYDVYALCGDGCLMEGSAPKPPHWPGT